MHPILLGGAMSAAVGGRCVVGALRSFSFWAGEIAWYGFSALMVQQSSKATVIWFLILDSGVTIRTVSENDANPQSCLLVLRQASCYILTCCCFLIENCMMESWACSPGCLSHKWWSYHMSAPTAWASGRTGPGLKQQLYRWFGNSSVIRKFGSYFE